MASVPAPFLYVVGPTGVGKSGVALRLAQQFQFPIVNCDSIQVYQKLDIGSAKPTLEERSKVPHFLFDYIAPPQQLTVGDYLRDVEKIVKQNKVDRAIFVGGSGFYVRALEKGVYPNSETSAEIKTQVKDWLEQEGSEAVYRWIQQRDPEFCHKLKPNDQYRIRRSAELMKSQGKTMSEIKKQMELENHSVLPANRSFKLGLRQNKERLLAEIEKRTLKMLTEGWIEEVDALVQEGLSNWPPLQSVGYREVQMYLQGKLDRPQLKDLIVTSTMQLVKKQMTWFKADTSIHWFGPEEIDEIGRCVESWMLTGNSNRV